QQIEAEEKNSSGAIHPMARRGWASFMDLVWTKARLNLKSEASRDRLHYLWWIIEPLILMGVYYVVFALLLNNRIDNYVPYLLTGVIPFQWFAKTVQQSANSIVGG